MRKVVLGIALLSAFGVAHAETQSNQLFDCMDAQSFEINNQCMADKISSNMQFRDSQANLVNIASESRGDYAIATMTFDQENMHIDVVAHREALNAQNTLAANRN
ncbi:pyridine nucleotide transhydrogenase [Alteromonas sp. 345S023]|uniref:Pyridine nucleotide transhydrogenase n=1 Tax=Alteromonas profundi TaxID=2696062 RepID=A0A7X5RMJ0_9ALTE|nr:pyridine nucleotide transhydrogenase [Alteromonas profundi]NDV92580.1 pyridine nucleotide transhydrogenase [Alteromonas profundi]